MDPLLSFLRSSRWQIALHGFVEENCEQFQGDDFHHSHFEKWREFQGVVEKILDEALTSFSSASRVDGLSDLEQELERVMREPAKGPKDDRIKELLSLLLTYHDFSSFADMMKSQAELQSVLKRPTDTAFMASDMKPLVSSSRIRHAQVDEIVKFGFSRDDVIRVAESRPDMSTEALINILMDSKEKGQGDSERMSSATLVDDDQALRLFVDDINGYRANVSMSSTNIDNAGSRYEEKDILIEPITLEEIIAKFKLAASIREVLDDGSSNAESGSLLLWAIDMLRLQYKVQTEYFLSQGRDTSLIEKYLSLESEGQLIDGKASGNFALSDADVARLVLLNEVAAEGTTEEQILHKCLLQYEEITLKVEGYHQRIAIFVSRDKCIAKHDLEDLFVYLKAEIASGINFESVADEMYQNILRLVSVDRASDVVNTLLDLHVAEEEQLLLKQKINRLMSIVADSPDRDREVDDIDLSLESETGKSDKSVFEEESGRTRAFDTLTDSKVNQNDDPNVMRVKETFFKHRKQFEDSLLREKNRRLQLMKERLENRRRSEVPSDSTDSNETTGFSIPGEDTITDFVQEALKAFDQSQGQIQHQDRLKMIELHVSSEKQLLESLASKRNEGRARLIFEIERRKRTALLQQISLSFLSQPASDGLVNDIKDETMQEWFDRSLILQDAVESLDDKLGQQLAHITLLFEDGKIFDNVDIDVIYRRLRTGIFKSFEETWQSLSSLSAKSDIDIKNLFLQRFHQSCQEPMELLRKHASELLMNRPSKHLHDESTDVDDLLLKDIASDPMKALGLDYSTAPSESFSDNRHISDILVSKLKAQTLLVAHSQNEKDMINELYSEMLRRKEILQERIRAKTNRMQSQNLKPKLDRERSISVSIEEDEIQRLECSFERIMRLLMEKRNKEDYDIASLVKMLEHFAHPGGALDADSKSMIRPEAKLSPSEIDRSFFQREAKRISLSAAAEQQKHEFTLKMQQVRERHKLNQKLEQRRNLKSLDNSLKLTSPRVGVQNSFLSTSPSRQQQQNQMSMRGMVSRGLSLTPMFRK